MANKLFIVFTTLAFCVLLTNASIYRTVVEFDEDDTTNQRGSQQGQQQKCQREFQQAEHLRACQQYIRQRAMQGPSPRSLDDEEFDFEDAIIKRGPQQRPQKQLLQQCCNELQQEDPQCVCPTLRQAAQAVSFQGQQQHGPFQARHIFQTAKHLPNVCDIPQVGTCPFRATPYY